ncbi:MAG TPA: MarR family EPS-associated transcriptional regulator [Syntrophales bacterium]|jgi:EPS-associated MarR family transcriptional regulator|nr:MarR family EPS-associated transcriptional regulator [Syntrophales bacterium]HOD98364.1 MarR family EPS-associated transcriptional regulator [Syntrophales bacterium]HOF06396.1 MarR family EPS-associated transcriptional regulator [Syntrophales bacterium]HOH73966.1 MarR family EPS-associated transcriptional regulator [Syntrophales bacterium]HQK79785.1 MarR family EPS-associated transcriptional regulator [Syntrophales bacterium]
MKATIEKTQILRDLARNPYISQRELAERHRISLGKVNYAIRALIKKGYIKLQNFYKSNNKRKYAYVLTPEGMHEKTKLTASFLSWKMKEYERIKQEIADLKQELDASE